MRFIAFLLHNFAIDPADKLDWMENMSGVRWKPHNIYDSFLYEP